VKKLQSESPGLEDHEALGKLIAYGSDQVMSPSRHLYCIRLKLQSTMQVHSSLDKSSVIAGVKFRKLETNEEFSLKGETLEDAIKVRQVLPVMSFESVFACMAISLGGRTSWPSSLLCKDSFNKPCMGMQTGNRQTALSLYAGTWLRSVNVEIQLHTRN
jgi:hypothetical protein